MMIEAIAIPVLMKAIDFLLDKGHKIIEERRERRGLELENELQKPNFEGTTITNVSSSEKAEIIQSKEELLVTLIDETAWQHSETKVKHLMSLLDIYTKNFYLAREQYARWGDALAPPIILHNLAEAEDQIAITAKELQSVLSELYAKQVIILEI